MHKEGILTAPRSFSNEKILSRGRDARYRSPRRLQRSGVPPGTFPNRWRCRRGRQGRPSPENQFPADSVTPCTIRHTPHPGWNPARGQIIFGLKLVSDGSRPLMGAESANFCKIVRQNVFPDDPRTLWRPYGRPNRFSPGSQKGSLKKNILLLSLGDGYPAS